MNQRDKIEALRRQDVTVPAPESLEIGDEVRLEQIRGPGTTLHAGTRLRGAELSVLPGARIGTESPVTLDGCAVGPDVELSGGSFTGAVLLDRVRMGSGAQVRAGTLMEEESNGAHTVGLKQTVLLPYVTLGSLINFCDVLMAGGTSRRDHSEVGSSFIHFNFTPWGRSGDKATPSLVGDVPRGVMLRSPRIFLGGQGGLVGPVQIDYNTVLAAGFVYRRDHGPDQLVIGEKLPPMTLPFDPQRYSRVRQKVARNLTYIGNLVALWQWYDQVRLPLASADPARAELYRRGRESLAGGIRERVKRLGQIAGYMEDSIRALQRKGGAEDEIRQQRQFAGSWPALEQALLGFEKLTGSSAAEQQTLRQGLERAPARTGDYLAIVKGLDEASVAAGSAWLASIVSQVEQLIWP
jgi:UDP-N-acetylglucosamine/UDP-N-acetylgalactosamine diphosphorylase